MAGGGRASVAATLTALRAGGAGAVAGGVPAAAIALLGWPFLGVAALAAGLVFAAFAGPITVVKARCRDADSPHWRRLPYRDRRRVMAAVLTGTVNVPATLAPAVAEQARLTLATSAGHRAGLALSAAGLALCLVGWAVSSAEGRTASSWGWPASGLLLLAAVAQGWWGEPRRQARARAALAAADPGPGG